MHRSHRRESRWRRWSRRRWSWRPRCGGGGERSQSEETNVFTLPRVVVVAQVEAACALASAASRRAMTTFEGGVMTYSADDDAHRSPRAAAERGRNVAGRNVAVALFCTSERAIKPRHHRLTVGILENL
jgi:hypothetical protein